MQTLKFGNGLVIPSHTLLDIWSFIHAGIKVNPYKWKGHWSFRERSRPPDLDLYLSDRFGISQASWQHVYRDVVKIDSFATILTQNYAASNPHANTNYSHVNYNDVIMGAMAYQITSLKIVYSTIYSEAYQRKHQSSASLAVCAGNSLVTGEFPAQTASNAENVSILWRHHANVNCTEFGKRGKFLFRRSTRKGNTVWYIGFFTGII